MAVPTTYFTSTKNLSEVLAAIRKASVPPKFTYDFLKKLGFPSSNDRPIIPMFKTMGFLDGSGTPLDRYKRFRDETQSRAVMAEGMREAYADVFAINQRPDRLPAEELKGIFSRLSGKSDTVADKMAMTFKALASHADFDAAPSGDGQVTPKPDVDAAKQEQQPPPPPPGGDVTRTVSTLHLRHDLHVHLPVSDDIAVYDAIFRALRQNFGE